MPTLEELQASMEQTGASQEERNRQIAQAVKAGQIGQSLGYEPMAHQGPELAPGEAQARFAGHQQELTDEEVAARMGEVPAEISAGPPIISDAPPDVFANAITSMAKNYQTNQKYREMLDQELEQISAQIDALTQRRNMIEMAIRGNA